ncbi:propionate catabolism operon regulatory protein PrpR, partial [Escherichia coli]
ETLSKSFPPAAEYPSPARAVVAIADAKYSADKTDHGETALAALRQGLQASETVLVHYDWPGNIRELRNMMERLALFLSVEPT